MKSGGHLLTKTLHAHGVDRIFCVAGESYLPVLDAVLDFPDIHVVTCRHESGATFMAESYAQLTGKTGVAMVTRAPGACNGSIGIHAAHQSSTPVLLFVGLINSMDRGREPFQDFDVPQMFGSLSKHACVIDNVERVADMVTHGLHLTQCGRPGPVVIGLPEEVLTNTAADTPVRPIPRAHITPSLVDMQGILQILSTAARPLILVGGSLWNDETCRALEGFAAAHNIPACASLRRQDIFNHTHKCYIGDVGFGPNPALIERVKTADVILSIGTRLDEITLQGYTLLRPEQKLIHVYPSAEEFGKTGANATPHLSIQSHTAPFIRALNDMDLPENTTWKTWCADGRKDYIDWTTMPEKSTSNWDGADMTQVFRQLRDLLPDDAIVTSDAGNFSGWLHRYLRFGRPARAFAPVCGGMGYAVPTAVASAIAAPDKLTLGVCGDGGFMMTAQEIATAMHHGAAPIIMVCNNTIYGTIRMHQQRDYPNRPSATDLTNPDFVKLGESYGAFAARVTHADQFTDVWNAALKSGKAAIIEIAMDPRQMTTNTQL